MSGKIVEAIGVASTASQVGTKALAKALEEAMSQAVRDMHAKGVTDPVYVRNAMLRARQAVMDAYRATAAQAQARREAERERVTVGAADVGKISAEDLAGS